MAPKKKIKKKRSAALKKSTPAVAVIPPPMVPVAPKTAPASPILSSVVPHTWTNGGTEVLILRRIPKTRIAHSGFVYPVGVGTKVEPKSWDPSTSCGGGLHGWPWGFGLGDGADYDVIEDIWLILGAEPADVVGGLEGGLKCKCRHATIRYEGNFAGAMALIRDGFHSCIVAMSKVTIPVIGAAQIAAETVSDKWYAQLAASGDYARLAASGNSAQLAASGNSAQLAASGNSARLAASGNSAQLAAGGDNSLVMIASASGRVKVGKNGTFALAHWIDRDRGYEILVGKVGVAGIEADTWYVVRNGKIEIE